MSALYTRRIQGAAGNAATEGRDGGLMVLRKVLFVLFVLSTYLEVPLYLTKTFFIPSFLTIFLLTPILGVLYHKRVYKYEAVFVGQVFFVLLLTALLSPGFAYIDQKLLGLFQTVVSIVGGVLLIKLMTRLPKSWITRVLLLLSVILVAGACLEVVGVLKGISDSFREVAYAEGGYGVYNEDERDVGITGFPRPKLFTSEPSLLAIGFFAFVNSWLLLTDSRRGLLVACSGTLLMFLLTGSPVLIVSLAVSLTIPLFGRAKANSAVTITVFACLMGLLVVYAQPEVVSSVAQRISSSYETAGSLQPTSENRRLFFPFITLVDVIKNSPLFGVGISGKEVIPRYSSLPVDPVYALGNNVLAWFFIYLGVAGSLMFVNVFFDYLRRLRIEQVFLLVILILGLTQMMGGFETPRFWGYVFLFIGVMKIRSGSGRMALSQARSPDRSVRTHSSPALRKRLRKDM